MNCKDCETKRSVQIKVLIILNQAQIIKLQEQKLYYKYKNYLNPN